MAQIKQILDNVLGQYRPEDMLVLFDIDLVLTAPCHPAAHYPNILKYRKYFKQIFNDLKPAQQKIALHLATLTTGQLLLEETAPALLSKLNHKGVKVIGFTGLFVGPLGHIDNAAQWRSDNLRKLGFDFRKAQGSLGDNFTLKTLQSFQGYYPEFQSGILYANGEVTTTKGRVLIAFLQHVVQEVGWSPEVVIFIEDTTKNLENVQQSLAQHFPSINFVGIDYQFGRQFHQGSLCVEQFKVFWQDQAEKAKEIKP